MIRLDTKWQHSMQQAITIILQTCDNSKHRQAGIVTCKTLISRNISLEKYIHNFAGWT